MGKVWYCANCGYEVGNRGRCHSCREKLVPSDLPELEPAGDENEVGYRIGWWADEDRGRLIGYLNVLQVPHRFEEEELVVLADDEERVDDLLEELALSSPPAEQDEHGTHGDDGVDDDHDDETGTASAPSSHTGPGGAASEPLRMLAEAARRLTVDPTDMQADAEVAEASAGVFMEDEFYGTDAENWAAVGRVTRRLLVALGAEEAMEEEIRLQASILAKLLTGVTGEAAGDGATPGSGDLGVGTVYELPEWLPEQRAHLGVLLDGKAIPHEWDGDDLVVSSAREEDAEALFDLVGAPPVGAGTSYDDGEDGEDRYRAIEELFNAAGRLSSEPEDEHRRADLEEWAAAAEGPAPVGMDEVHWLRIINKAHAVCEAIRSDADPDAVASLSGELHDLLRTVV